VFIGEELGGDHYEDVIERDVEALDFGAALVAD
jgi:hypothetical protein